MLSISYPQYKLIFKWFRCLHFKRIWTYLKGDGELQTGALGSSSVKKNQPFFLLSVNKYKTLSSHSQSKVLWKGSELTENVRNVGLRGHVALAKQLKEGLLFQLPIQPFMHIFQLITHSLDMPVTLPPLWMIIAHTIFSLQPSFPFIHVY